jgi:NADPH-dependent glutamate synthase beta subunit-like oxidoreductase
MRWGIPEYRLPKTVLKREIQRILNLGLEMKTGVRAGQDPPFNDLERFDAIFLAPGAGLSGPLQVEGEALQRVWRGVDFLRRINSGDRVRPGKEVLVIGGGNTAMDVARSALRLQAQVTIAYRRTRDQMPAIPEEITKAEEEGAQFEFLSQPVKVSLLKNRKLAVTFQRTKLGDPDENHRPRPVPLRGRYFTLEADHLIAAAGERVDLSWIPQDLTRDGLIDAGSSLRSGRSRIFAGGDAIDQPRTIVMAVASGKKAAISIDCHLRGLEADQVFPKIGVGTKGSLSMETYLYGRDEGKWPEPMGVVSYDRINTLYFEPSQKIPVRKLGLEQRRRSFSEVNGGLSPEEAGLSASRCFSCGTCNYCYNCYFFCPEGVISLDAANRTKTVDLAHCKGCGTCATSCPRNVVEMKEVP